MIEKCSVCKEVTLYIYGDYKYSEFSKKHSNDIYLRGVFFKRCLRCKTDSLVITAVGELHEAIQTVLENKNIEILGKFWKVENIFGSIFCSSIVEHDNLMIVPCGTCGTAYNTRYPEDHVCQNQESDYEKL